jgi:phosphatidylserine decarboxylase
VFWGVLESGRRLALQYGAMKIDKAGWPFVAGAALPGVVAAWLGWFWVAGVFGALALFMLFFFRDPDRSTPADPLAIMSPADGRVLVAGEAEAAAAPEGTWKQLSIFLSPMDVHINRMPCAGRVTKVVYTPGRFLAAYNPDSARVNERNEVWLDRGGDTVVVRQVVGVLARRLVCRVGAGADVRTGERYGLMKFGSRIDLYLPPRCELKVRVGDRVRSGETVVATW